MSFRTSIYARSEGSPDFGGAAAAVTWSILASRCEECGASHEEVYRNGRQVTYAYQALRRWEAAHHCVELGVSG